MLGAIYAQLTPGDASAWNSIAEKLTVVGLLLMGLLLVLLSMYRKWFMPSWFYVEMKEQLVAQIAELTVTIEKLREENAAQRDTINRLLGVSETVLRR